MSDIIIVNEKFNSEKFLCRNISYLSELCNKKYLLEMASGIKVGSINSDFFSSITHYEDVEPIAYGNDKDELISFAIENNLTEYVKGYGGYIVKNNPFLGK